MEQVQRRRSHLRRLEDRGWDAGGTAVEDVVHLQRVVLLLYQQAVVAQF
jgi:hypothetical protein